MKHAFLLLLLVVGCGRRPPEPAPRVELRRHEHGARNGDHDVRPTAQHRRRGRAVEEGPDPLGGAGFDDLRDLGTAGQPADPAVGDTDLGDDWVLSDD